jgi:16S rRNA (uracil1498-N3)-methyltransferase
MHRLYIPPAECQGDVVCLSERESHHAVDVLRVRAGERVTVLDGAGHELVCELVEPSRRGALLRVIERRVPATLSAHITLLQAVPKAKAMDTIIQKATELGARRIVPLLTGHCTVQLDAEDAVDKQAKWQQTAIEAMKQCGAPWLPVVERPLGLKEFLADGGRFDLSLVGSLQPGSRHPRAWFEEFTRMSGKLPATVSVWVGPEGDFSREEIAAIEDAGAQPVTLGPLVLRSETAAIYLLSVVSYELQAGQGTGAGG